MSKYNWDLTRVGRCRHSRDTPNIYVDMEKIVYSKHTGKRVIQVWTGQDDGNSINGWACVHSDNDSEEIKNYLKEKEVDLKE